MGRRGANQTAVILAGVGTLACGLSNSMEMLIAARFVRCHASYVPCYLTIIK
jgi:MFS family permease